MPFGKYKTFTSCMKDQKKKGYSEKAAGGICGLIEKRHKAKLEKRSNRKKRK